MTGHQHYSFDLWLTLIKSNPLFKKHRSKYFHQHFNFQHISLEDVEQKFRMVDLMCNAINERTGKNIDADEMYLMVISLINNNQINLHDIDIEHLYTHMEALVFDYMPQVYDPDTINLLAILKSRGATTNILSNTGFIKGVTLRKVLQQLALAPYFDFQLYSDEAGMSKPNPAFFELMIIQARQLAHVQLQNITHVGDNPRADIEGALYAGINATLINSNQVSILTLNNHEPSHIFPS
ncbi:HAD family hydrolase [Mucilaginibacter sp. CSA2-8R]|uniref:HAD family hydrolase n=1 Tax=Mucilaginibacter sp. CSA2-8R TaxID=3141542 RepID=UPI00315D6E7F